MYSLTTEKIGLPTFLNETFTWHLRTVLLHSKWGSKIENPAVSQLLIKGFTLEKIHKGTQAYLTDHFAAITDHLQQSTAMGNAGCILQSSLFLLRNSDMAQRA